MKHALNHVGCVLAILVLTGQVIAAPVTVMVLPIGGTADPALRASLSRSVEKVAQTGGGHVKSGATTFSETAAAVGCDPADPPCAERVRTTLAVDELVYGTAMATEDGQVTIEIHKQVKGKDPEVVTTTIAPTDPPDRIEPMVTPMFGSTAPPPVTCPDNAVPNVDGTCPTPPPPPPPPRQSRTNRNLAIASAVGAGVMLIAGLGMWKSKSNLQGQINDHPIDTLSDFQQLQSLEDRASSRAWFGNLLIAGSLGLGYLTYYFWNKDRRAQSEGVMVTPAPAPGGAAVVLTITR